LIDLIYGILVLEVENEQRYGDTGPPWSIGQPVPSRPSED